MSRFRRVREHPMDMERTVPRPTLEAVLDHYGVRYQPGRYSQMVSCPLHEDRTPSLSLNLNEGVWRCHSCSEGGDAYSLIMKKEGLDFVRAVELVSNLGIAEEVSRGGGNDLPEGRFARRRPVSKGSRDRKAGGGWRPSWGSR